MFGWLGRLFCCGLVGLCCEACCLRITFDWLDREWEKRSSDNERSCHQEQPERNECSHLVDVFCCVCWYLVVVLFLVS